MRVSNTGPVRSALLLTLVALTTVVHGQGAVITIDLGTTFQTMRGWEAAASAEQHRPDFPAYAGAALAAVVDAGINRVRLEVRSGSENTVDAFAEWRAAGYPTSGPNYAAWRARRYETINDNGSPTATNAARFHWSELDDTIDKIVVPMRQRLAARGEALYVNLTYVAFIAQVTSGAPYVHQDPAEYAEFMLAAFQHLQATYGWTPDGIEVMLEPDNVSPPWSGTQMGLVIAATASRLAAAGFSPDFIGASTTCLSSAPTWFDQLAAVPNALAPLKELSYHRYCGVDAASLQGIASRASSRGIASAMLEWWDPGLTFHTLHEDVKVGRSGAWAQAVLADHGADATLAVAFVDGANQATMSNRTRFLRQYYQHVRRGAVRVGATSTASTFDPLAFRGPDGSVTVVVKAGGSGTFSIDGLPAGTYGLTYTASSFTSPEFPDLEGTLPNQTIGSGQRLTTSIPAYGVLTVSSRMPSIVAAPHPPGSLQVTAIDGQRVTFSWTPPSTGPAPTGFQIEGGVAPGQVLGAVPVGLTPTATVTLPQGHFYVRVRSVAGAAMSTASNEVLARVDPGLAPSAPQRLRGLAVGAGLHLTWSNTLLGGPPAGATLEVSGAIQATLPLGLTDTFDFSGVPPGSYTFTVRTSNQAGASSPSNAVTLTFPGACLGPPPPVASVAAFALGRTLFVHWDSGAEGAAPTAFLIDVTGGLAGRFATPLTSANGGVPPGSYVLRIATTNACGTSSFSAPTTVTVQ
jgi:Glycosyl hydrolase family 30 beta sandwich domain